ncbi:MAG: PIN domain-containing protein [Methylovulum sp.]|uniref:PIN domain-containing protein n=1 Tax=Methylovulum sp. TaxID=1916980 RepID=UPI002624DFB8|nr:PIN domain-containing protein [Methylovulum sp.]MDD2724903.1 PIN domain-containing protein [Methylovulum sp.]MDD5124695.1 PIN domain-containing protein [Methylovulum sp.]
MMALDINVLIRFLLKDDEQQAQRVYQLFKQTEAKQDVLFVPLLVVLETIWVLQSAYGIADAAILAALGELLLMPVLRFEKPSVIQGLIASGRDSNFDLADLLISYSAISADCNGIYTFDKKAAKFKHFERFGL